MNHLTKERIQITGLQVEPLNDLWICSIETMKNLIIVALSDVALWEIKCIQQCQDISANTCI